MNFKISCILLLSWWTQLENQCISAIVTIKVEIHWLSQDHWLYRTLKKSQTC